MKGSPVQVRASALWGITAVRQVAMGRFEIGQVDAIAFAAHRSLHRDQIGEGTNRGLNAIDTTSVRAGQKLSETDSSGPLGEQIKIPMRGGQVNRPISSDAAV